MTEFEDFLSNTDLLSGKNIILGDFNIHYDIPTKSETVQLNRIISSFGYHQLIDVPTHRHNHTLDLLIVKDDEKLIKNWEVDPIFHSDHLIINCLLDITGASPSRTFTASRNFSKIDHQVFASDLALQLKSIHNKMKYSATVDDLVDGYYNACKFVLDAHAPEKIKHRSVRFKPKWFNENVVEARRERRRHERRWRKSGSDSDYQKYIDARRASADIISAEKSEILFKQTNWL